MSAIDKPIISFIKKHHVLTLATNSEEGVYCSNMFYAYDTEQNRLIFTSDNKTKHIQDILQNNKVAASIVLETKIVGKIQGLQLNGLALRPEGEYKTTCKNIYLKRFPYALLAKTNFWFIDLSFAKFTNNQMGFGDKTIWHKNQDI